MLVVSYCGYTDHVRVWRECTSRSFVYLAACIEHDLMAQGPTVEEALERLKRTFAKQIECDSIDGVQPLSKLDPSPVPKVPFRVK